MNDMMMDHLPPRPLTLSNVMTLFLVVFGIDVIVIAPWLSQHAPLSDDLSMIAFSASPSLDWLTKGLADYFIVYPEYYAPQSNFIRPVSNLVYFLFHALITADAPFLANRIQLVALNYGTHAALAVMIFATARRYAGAGPIAWAALIAAFAMPPFWTTPATTYSSFVFDELAMLFCLIAFRASISRRVPAVALYLTLAILTKEIALPVIAGFAAHAVIMRNGRALAAPLFALAVWGLLRMSAFGLEAEGLYVFETSARSFADVARDKLLNALSLPLGPVAVDAIFTEAGHGLLSRDGMLLIGNLAFYALAISYLPRALRALRKAVAEKQADPVLLPTLIALGAFVFDVYIGQNYRYALNFVPFVILALAGLATTPVRRGVMFAVMALGGGLASATFLERLIAGPDVELFRYQAMRDLFAVLRAHPESDTILIANDFVSGYANPAAFNILLPTGATIMRGTSLYLDTCGLDDIKSITTRVIEDQAAIRITADLPDCARFTFESAPKLNRFVEGTQIKRNDRIAYDIAPDAQWTGRHLTMAARKADLVYFDFQTGQWRFVAAVK